MKALIASILCFAHLYAQQPRSFQLNCRAGVSLSPSIQNSGYGMSGPVLVGDFGHVNQASTPRPGTCTWVDRPLGPTEPHRFCMAVTAPDLRRNGAAGLIAALGSTDGTAALMVYNNGGACMVVTKIVSTNLGFSQVTQPAVKTHVSIDEIRARLRPRPTTATKGEAGGKSDQAAGPGSLPRPPRADEVTARVRAHGDALLQIVRGLLDSSTMNQYLSEERARCGQEAFCLMDLRRTAVAVAVQGR